MKYFLKSTCYVFAVFLILSLAATSSLAHTVELATGKTVALEEMVDDLQQARVIFVGEDHQEVGHHRAQLQIIKALEKAGKKVAIGLEMFRTDSQQALDDWVAGNMITRDFLIIYNQNWNMWGIYADIYFYARDRKIPMVGLNISRDITRLVARKGFAALSEKQLKKLPYVQCRVDKAYMDFIRRALGGHKGQHIQFKNFCEAQLLWDKVMAKNLSDYLLKNPDKTVVVLAGGTHSWKYGIPAQLAEISDAAYRVLLPEMPDKLVRETISEKDADYLMIGVDKAPLH